MGYMVPTPDLLGVQGEGGTSSAAPLWAALTSQIDAIFQDQGLPQLGYYNDLLYTAAAIAPASFNDITLGNNTSSVALGGIYITKPPEGSPISSDVDVTPTGYGYSAEPGYDLTTGLGTPNGTLLARALTWIAHSQMSFSNSPDMLDPFGAGGWKSLIEQSLLFQTTSHSGTVIPGSNVSVDVLHGSDNTGFISAASAPFAWTSQLAQQVLQPDFDPTLVRLFDMQSQGALVQTSVGAGDQFAVAINAAAASTPQADLTSPYGFVDFVSGPDMVHVARSVAIAETADGLNDQLAIVRMRQGGGDTVSLTLYRVDDFDGTINGLHPGTAGYAAAADARAYQMTSGGTSIVGPGYGNFSQTAIEHVNAGDLVAMKLTNATSGDTYWAFAQANEMVNGVPVGHLWNYGANTWGWEDLQGGGDRDFNDLVVQVDFTSASGHGWLVM
jgi:hypothetical protein